MKCRYKIIALVILVVLAFSAVCCAAPKKFNKKHFEEFMTQYRYDLASGEYAEGIYEGGRWLLCDCNKDKTQTAWLDLETLEISRFPKDDLWNRKNAKHLKASGWIKFVGYKPGKTELQRFICDMETYDFGTEQYIIQDDILGNSKTTHLSGILSPVAPGTVAETIIKRIEMLIWQSEWHQEKKKRDKEKTNNIIKCT